MVRRVGRSTGFCLGRSTGGFGKASDEVVRRLRRTFRVGGLHHEAE